MVTTVEMKQIKDFHRLIRNAVRELVDEIIVEVLLDDGTRVKHKCPSLLDQLEECITNKKDDPSSGSGRRRVILICVEAFDLRNLIKKEFIEFGGIRSVSSHVAMWTDVEALMRVYDRLVYVADVIRAIIDPPRRYHIAAACPACDSRMAIRRDSAGDLIQVPALTVNGVDGCVCLACGATWPPGQLEHLALVLGCEPLGPAESVIV